MSEVKGKVFTPWTFKIVEILGSSESISLIKLINSNCILTDFSPVDNTKNKISLDYKN